MDKFFVIYCGSMICVERQVNESDLMFTKKIEFFICSLDQGEELKKAYLLSNAYVNRLLYMVKYPEQIENDLKKIINMFGLDDDLDDLDED